jgi:hypothetical protein
LGTVLEVRPLTPEVRALVDALEVTGGEVVLPRSIAREWSDRVREERDLVALQAIVEELVGVVAALRRRLGDGAHAVALEILGWVSPAIARLDSARDRLKTGEGSLRAKLLGATERAAVHGMSPRAPTDSPSSNPAGEGIRPLEIRARESRSRPRKKQRRKR